MPTIIMSYSLSSSKLSLRKKKDIRNFMSGEVFKMMSSPGKDLNPSDIVFEPRRREGGNSNLIPVSFVIEVIGFDWRIMKIRDNPGLLLDLKKQVIEKFFPFLKPEDPLIWVKWEDEHNPHV